MAVDVETLLERLRAGGYRITAQRRMVLEVLLAYRGTHHHLSCEQITQAVNARGLALDATTVYRILQWLKEAQVVAQTDVGLGYDVYSLVEEHPHHHLICLNCHATLEADDTLFTALREQLAARYGFQARIEHFAIFGLCAQCAEDVAASRDADA
ncbi:MAG: Fur family transcriptional regulator [Anaerolineae bacterium]